MAARTVLLKVGLFTALIGMAGCFSSNPKDIQVFTKPSETIVNIDRYIMRPPDEIEIRCSAVSEVHLQKQRIRPDGKLALEGIGEVEAAGRTPRELSEDIRVRLLNLYALQGEHPIEVNVSVYTSTVYYVLGEVARPGPRPCTGRDMLLKALADAHPTPLAWEKRIQVVRPSEDPKAKARIFEFNYKNAIAHGKISKNVLLQEGDIVYVPPTILAGIAMKVEEFVRPIARAFSTVNVVTPPGTTN